MKSFIFCLMLVLLSSFAPEQPAPFHFTLPIILAILAGFYEVISRIIPTTATWSIIGKFLEFLTWLSNLFNRKK